jgi:hypothetical protein
MVDAVNSGNIPAAQNLFPQLQDLSSQIVEMLIEIRREYESSLAKAA